MLLLCIVYQLVLVSQNPRLSLRVRRHLSPLSYHMMRYVIYELLLMTDCPWKIYWDFQRLLLLAVSSVILSYPGRNKHTQHRRITRLLFNQLEFFNSEWISVPTVDGIGESWARTRINTYRNCWSCGYECDATARAGCSTRQCYERYVYFHPLYMKECVDPRSMV